MTMTVVLRMQVTWTVTLKNAKLKFDQEVLIV